MILIDLIGSFVVCAGHKQCLLAILHLLESLIVVLLHLLILKQAGDAIRTNHHLLLALNLLHLRHLELQLIADGLLQGPLVNLFDPGLLPACPTSLGWQFFHLLALLIIELVDHELL